MINQQHQKFIDLCTATMTFPLYTTTIAPTSISAYNAKKLIHPKTILVEGIEKERCNRLIQQFFQKLRAKKKIHCKIL